MQTAGVEMSRVTRKENKLRVGEELGRRVLFISCSKKER